jgi:hypothetical protein
MAITPTTCFHKSFPDIEATPFSIKTFGIKRSPLCF